jgi:hypothetical protein
MINSSDSFLAALLVNGTMGIFSVQQISTGIRYIYKDKIREDFPKFEPL